MINIIINNELLGIFNKENWDMKDNKRDWEIERYCIIDMSEYWLMRYGGIDVVIIW